MFSTTFVLMRPISKAYQNTNLKQPLTEKNFGNKNKKIMFSGHTEDSFAREFKDQTDFELPDYVRKALTKPFRKMGHVTIVDADREKAIEKARFVQKTLKVIS